MESAMNVLIVCGQGTYKDGRFYTEYPDRDVYVGHALSVRELVREWKYTHVVCSGSFTQMETPSMSEAESMVKIWDEFGAKPTAVIIKDELALDSAENVLLGLMALRQKNTADRIRRIGVSAAWQFKKSRFNRLAETLGIVSQFYFHGYQSEEAADAGDKALQGEIGQLQLMAASKDYLLLDTQWENKRKARYQKSDYDNRLNSFRNLFKESFATLDILKLDVSDDGKREKLQEEFSKEVLK